MTTETTPQALPRRTESGMQTRAVNAAAGVLLAAMQQGRQTPTGLAVALDAAQLLNSPERAAYVAQLEKAAVEARGALAALCHDLEDPGSNAFGALYLLSQVTVCVAAQPDETAKVVAHHDAEVLRAAAAELMAACPDHGDADEVWMDCPCEYADELERKAVLVETGAAS